MNTKTAGRRVWTWSAIATSTAAQLVEIWIVGAALFGWGLTRPDPDPEADSPAFFLVFGVPILTALLTVVCSVVTLALVMPTVTLAHRVGRRWGGDALWWTPATSAVTSAAAVGATGLGAAVFGGHVGAPVVYAWWWFAITVLIAPAGMTACLSSQRTALGRPSLWRPLLLRGGAGAVAVAVVATFAGILWETATG
ncbi:hypothetical protein J1792_15400 [Streptomyces triculaminicus]|uniref:Uncharacterized protein n=2 Tax=Streptomyces TaxID=1883 RepID=A0A939FNT6_9ACTN|nr:MULTISPECIES: hypothetical protein [Streptomyces]MBO0654109.1 hypothetical protein [Streptomyces triculaminicus]QSY48793.1 hypothetical protein J3S04_27780 [Streptomyces griseocarneus]